MSTIALPELNSALLLFILVGGFFAFKALFRRATMWTGPSQDRRIALAERNHDDVVRRVGNLEENSGRQFRDLLKSFDGLHAEIRLIADRLVLLSNLHERVSVLEANHDSFEQRLQLFQDLGCGNPGCPWSEAIKNGARPVLIRPAPKELDKEKP